MADDRGPRPGDLDHRLGPVVGVRTQPGALAAGQDHGLTVGYVAFGCS